MGADPFDSPPAPLVKRVARVGLDGINTLRYPGDIERKNPAPWFASNTPHLPTDGNDVRLLVEGENAIREMGKAIAATGNAPNDYIFMLNWFADPYLVIPGRGLFGELLAEKLQANVQIRGMFWEMPIGDQNKRMVEFLNIGVAEAAEGETPPFIRYIDKQKPNTPRAGAAIWDDRLNRFRQHLLINPFTGEGFIVRTFLPKGTHHQKVLCVKAGDSLVTFTGGVDFNFDRLSMIKETFHGAPLHDVHLRIVGPASAFLVKTFVERWTDHPESERRDTEAGEPLRIHLPANARDLDPAAQPLAGRIMVQGGRTFGAGPLMPPIGVDVGPFDASGRNHYRFAPTGERSIAAMLTNAILHAKQYVYIEDQYLVHVGAAEILAKALKNGVKHVIIVVPHHAIGDLPMMVRHRRKFIQTLRDVDPERVHVFYRAGLRERPPAGQPDPNPGVIRPEERPGGHHTYVHSKVTIIDDEFAVVGTANYNRRGWEHDSEISLGLYDPGSDRVLTNRLARWLRMRLWAEHLFGTIHAPSPPGGPVEIWDKEYAEVFDPNAAAAHWVELQELEAKHEQATPAGRKSRPYNQSQFSTAQVRPYDTHFEDEPDEIFPLPTLPLFRNMTLDIADEQLWDSLLDPGV
jgi:phosphatidylserine/phosphatidylglycerophosphate/cardiolipin synthase-like enzyme